MRRAGLGALAVPLAAIAWLLWPALRGDAILAFRDMLQNYWPMKALFWAAPGPLLPTWNPWFFGGTSLLGDLVQQPLYLPNLIFRALRAPAWPGIAFYLLLHAALALWGTAALLRRIASPPAAALGACALLLSGFFVADLSNLNWYCAAAWAPVVLYACDRVARHGRPGDGALFGLSLAQVVLASDPQLALVLLASSAGLLALRLSGSVRARVAPLAVAAAGTLLLCAPQIVASLQLLQLVVRGAALDDAATREQWSFHPARIPEFFVPRLYGPLFEPGFWGAFTVQPPWKRSFIHSVYVGAAWPALCAAALLARRRAALWLLLAMALVGAVALGAHGLHVYAWLGKVVPTWSLYRYPERLLVVPTLAAAALAAVGADGLASLPRRRRALLVAGSVACGLLALFACSALAPGAPLQQEASRAAVLRSALHLVLAGGAALLAACSPRAPILALTCALALDLCAANGELTGLLPRAPFSALPRACAAIDARGLPRSSFRVFDDQAALREDKGALPPEVSGALPQWGKSRWLEYQGAKRNLFSLCGFREAIALTSLEPRDAAQLWRAAGAVRALSAASTRFALTAPGSPLSRAGRAVWTDAPAGLALIELPAPLPRLYRPGEVQRGSAAVVLAALRDDARLLTTQLAVIDGDGQRHEPAQGARVLSFDDEGGVIRATIEQEAAGAWVLTDSLDDTWQATIDGAPAPLRVADVAHRALFVPAGRHALVLRAAPTRVQALFALSLLALCGLAFLGLRPGPEPPARRG